MTATDDVSRYSIGAYLLDRIAFVAMTALLIAIISIVLAVLDTSMPGIVFIDVMMAIGAMSFLAFEYAKRVRFYRQLGEATEAMEQAHHLTYMVEKPDFLEGRIAYEALSAAVECADEEITSLKEANRANSEYINSWVHEVKTPIAAARLIAGKIGGAESKALERELERTERLTEQALYAARAESLEHDYLIREVSLAEVAQEACKSNMHYLMSFNVSIGIQIPPGLTVFADKTWLGFIITQIVTNSAKYGAKTIEFCAKTPDEESSESQTILEVRDDGCGIPASDVPRVFDRGFTGEVGRAHGSATGMGLYLAARMCAEMGLGIMLASEEGTGTRIVITFPHDRRRAKFASTNTPHSHESPAHPHANLTDM